MTDQTTPADPDEMRRPRPVPRAETPRHRWPLPDDTDRVSAGAAAIRALGNAIDDDLPTIWTTGITIQVNNASVGTQQTINYAAAGFTSNPRVFIQPIGTTGFVGVTPSTPGLQNAVINVRHMDAVASTAAIPCHVLVIGPSSGTRAEAAPEPLPEPLPEPVPEPVPDETE